MLAAWKQLYFVNEIYIQSYVTVYKGAFWKRSMHVPRPSTTIVCAMDAPMLLPVTP